MQARSCNRQLPCCSNQTLKDAGLALDKDHEGRPPTLPLQTNTMTDSPALVSIALATYNGARYLPIQMDSLLAQRYPHFEIVVADDGSSDETLEILQGYAARDARVRLLPSVGNRGFNGNFMRCFAACRGELISPADQDDRWHPDKIRLLVEAIGDAALIYGNSRFVDGEGLPLGRTMAEDLNMITGSDPRHFLLGNSVSGHAMVFRKGLLAKAGEIPASLYYDWWLGFVAASTSRLAYLDQVLVDYRRHIAAVTYTPPQQNHRERSLKTLRTHALRFEAMAAYPSIWQPQIEQLRAAWWQWYRGFFGWQLFRLVLRDAGVLYFTSRANQSALNRANKYLFGHRFKRLLRPARYLPIDLPDPYRL